MAKKKKPNPHVIKRLRGILCETQVDFAFRVGTSLAVIANIESGRTPLLREMAEKVATALDINPYELLAGRLVSIDGEPVSDAKQIIPDPLGEGRNFDVHPETDVQVIADCVMMHLEVARRNGCLEPFKRHLAEKLAELREDFKAAGFNDLNMLNACIAVNPAVRVEANRDFQLLTGLDR